VNASARSEIFARLRGVSIEASAERIALDRQALGSAPAPAPPAAEMCEAFLINVLKNRGSVDCVSNRTEAVAAIGHHIYSHFRSHRLVAGNDPRLAAMPWRDAGVLPRFGSLEVGEPVALSFAQLGIVETGSIMTWTGRSNPAANNLLPDHHIVLVDTADLVSTMEHAWGRINQELEKNGRPRGINFIAGPSSTADIEGQLVYGAHGPRRWHVILMGDVPTNALTLARAAVK
jgi:L-lactate dehydrogenase complex protein LldG|tara:strand:+ start:13459 stop:14154 length:696 start_codon:yes stop_codon:yes gene_type:complete